MDIEMNDPEDVEDEVLAVANAAQDWFWEEEKEDPIGQKWKKEPSKRLSEFKNKAEERKMWRWKMAGLSEGVPHVCVCERAVNMAEFRLVNITQKFERLGWERALDWTNGKRSKIYLQAICDWMASLRLEARGPPATWKLIGEVAGRKMIMSFETMNKIANFDSLGVGEYTYPTFDAFWSPSVLESDPSRLTAIILPDWRGGKMSRNEMTLEGKILQNISLENLVVRFRDRGFCRTWDLRVIYALLFGAPKYSFRHICMMNFWDSREMYGRKMIPYVRLINELLIDQNCIPAGALWVNKPVEAFDFKKMRKSDIFYNKVEHNHTFNDKGTGKTFVVRDASAPPLDAPEVGRVDVPDLSNLRRQSTTPWGRGMPPELAQRVIMERPGGFESWGYADRQIYDNITRSRLEAEMREEARRAHKREREELEDRRARAYALELERDRVNRFMMDEQNRHHRDLREGRPYQQFAPWIDYSTIRTAPRAVQDGLQWPQGISSSYVPSPPPQPAEGGSSTSPFDNFQEMWGELVGLPYQPYPPRDPNERYYR